MRWVLCLPAHSPIISPSTSIVPRQDRPTRIGHSCSITYFLSFFVLTCSFFLASVGQQLIATAASSSSPTATTTQLNAAISDKLQMVMLLSFVSILLAVVFWTWARGFFTHIFQTLCIFTFCVYPLGTMYCVGRKPSRNANNDKLRIESLFLSLSEEI